MLLFLLMAMREKHCLLQDNQVVFSKGGKVYKGLVLLEMTT